MMRGMLSPRGVAAFASGAAAALLASRMLPPVVGQVAGRARVAAGSDPFDWLDRDHRFVLGQLEDMSQSQSAFQRTQKLLRVKRALTAHSLAEENALYPLLHDSHDQQLAKRLYAGHAEIKVRLHALEEVGSASPAWEEAVNVLRRAIEEHVAEEQGAFDLLRGQLDRAKLAKLAGALAREKEMVL